MNRSPIKVTAAVACAVALMLPLSGCGKDDKSKGSATSTLDPATARYVAAVEPICMKAQTDLQAIAASFATQPTDAEFTASLARASDLILMEIDAVKAVAPPEPLTYRVDGWLAALEKAAKKMPKLTKADTVKGIDIFVDSDPIARDLGLGRCTSNGE